MKASAERMIIVALLALLAIVAMRGCFRQKEKTAEQRQLIVQKTDSLDHYRDAAGREHARRLSSEADSRAVAAVYRNELDSFKAALNIAQSQIKDFAMIGTTAAATVPLRIDTVFIDSSAGYRFSYADRWLSVSGIVAKDSRMQYTYRDSLHLATYTKRRWLLGRKSTYVDAWSMNPNVRISGLNSVRISEERAGRFCIGPFVGFGYSGNSWAPSVGVALNYALIRF